MEKSLEEFSWSATLLLVCLSFNVSSFQNILYFSVTLIISPGWLIKMKKYRTTEFSHWRVYFKHLTAVMKWIWRKTCYCVFSLAAFTTQSCSSLRSYANNCHYCQMIIPMLLFIRLNPFRFWMWFCACQWTTTTVY